MIVGSKVSLGPFTWEQAQDYLQWVNQEDTAQAVTRALPVTPLEHQQWYEGLVRRQDAVVFAVSTRDTQDYIGNVWLWGIHPVHRHAELRILLGPASCKGQGYGSDACWELLRFAFFQLNLNKVYLYVRSDNVAAIKAFEKAGFVPEGRLQQEYFSQGAYVDALRMAVLRENFKDKADRG